MKSFLSDRNRVATPVLVHAASEPGSPLDPASRNGKTHLTGATGTGHASQVECVRQGDKIARLIVTCGCGERIEIDCLYTGT